ERRVRAALLLLDVHEAVLAPRRDVQIHLGAIANEQLEAGIDARTGEAGIVEADLVALIRPLEWIRLRARERQRDRAERTVARRLDLAARVAADRDRLQAAGRHVEVRARRLARRALDRARQAVTSEILVLRRVRRLVALP